MLSQSNPDMIVLTGDLIDSRHTDIEIALEFARQAIKLAPVYYVSGNHEARVRKYEDLKMVLWKEYEHNRDGYTEAKAEFVKRCTEQAKILYGRRY